jgi:hypothetical protein
MTSTSQNQWPDEVKRIADVMNMHALMHSQGWAVFALADGKSLDNTPYPTWSDAVKAARWDRDNYMYVEIQPDGMQFKEAAAILHYARTMNKMGHRIPSPDWEAGSMASSMPRTPFDRMRMIRQLVSGKPILPDDIPYGNLPNAFRKD